MRKTAPFIAGLVVATTLVGCAVRPLEPGSGKYERPSAEMADQFAALMHKRLKRGKVPANTEVSEWPAYPGMYSADLGELVIRTTKMEGGHSLEIEYTAPEEMNRLLKYRSGQSHCYVSQDAPCVPNQFQGTSDPGVDCDRRGSYRIEAKSCVFDLERVLTKLEQP